MITPATKPIDRILPLLKYYKSYSNGYIARCPSHADKNPSLMIWEDTTDDHVGLKCFSGCTRKQITAAIGIDETALYIQLNRPSRPKLPGITLIDLAVDKLIHPHLLTILGAEDFTYKGRDAVRIPYYTQDGKEYTRSRIRTSLSAKEGSRWSEGDDPLIPYGLQKLSEAQQEGYIVIVEGESDCWTLWQHHFPALGLPGASSYNLLQPSYFVDIKQVYIIQEPDGAGEKFPVNIKQRLKAIGYTGKVQVIPLAQETGRKDPNELHKQDIHAFKTTFLTLLKKIDTPPDEAPVGTLLSDVTPEAIRWLWKGRLAPGKITMLDGDPGLGKSNVTLDIAARISTGHCMPDGESCIKGGVVLITLEDGLADTIQPRLARAGADLSKIVSLGFVNETDSNTGYTYQRPFTLPDDLPLLEAAIKRVDAKLIIIDPVMGILGNKDTYKDNEVRMLLAPVQMLMETYHASAILVRHLTKNGGDNALYRGGGSIAFIGLARLGLMIARDPIDENKRVLATIKANISKLAVNLTYSIASDEEQGDERPYIVWEGISTHSVQELITATTHKPGQGRMDILQALREVVPVALSIQDIAERLPDMSKNNITVTLKRMVDDRQVEKSARGLYCLPK